MRNFRKLINIICLLLFMRIWMILTFSNPPSLFNCYFPSSSLFLVCLSLLSLPSFSLSILSLPSSSSLLSSPFSFLSLPPFPPSSISCIPFLLSLPSFSLSILSLPSSFLLSSPFSFLSLPPLFLYAFPLHSPPPFSLPFPPSSISCMPFLHFLYLPSLLSSPFPFSSPATSPLLPPSLLALSFLLSFDLSAYFIIKISAFFFHAFPFLSLSL